MTDQKRPYRKKKRAEQEEATRRRIVESAVELHGTIGPVDTPMSSVADHAGVPRSTLYRHFKDEGKLMDACSAHWAEQNPLPDPEPWTEIDDPALRLRTALSEIYSFFDRTSGMLANLYRDERRSADIARRFGEFRQYFDGVGGILIAGWPRSGKRRQLTAAAIRHVLDFHTWRSLNADAGLGSEEAVELAARFVAAAGAQPARSIGPKAQRAPAAKR